MLNIKRQINGNTSLIERSRLAVYMPIYANKSIYSLCICQCDLKLTAFAFGSM